MSKSEKSNVSNLGVLLRHFVGLELTVELKNGRVYRGQLHDADDYMNLVIRKSQPNNYHTLPAAGIDASATESSPALPLPVPVPLSTLDDLDYHMVHIRASSIRYVIFPDNADLPKLVRLGLDRIKTVTDKYARGKRKIRSSTT